MPKVIHLDTSFLASALTPFLDGPNPSPSQIRDALELGNYLISAETIALDGGVRQWTDTRIRIKLERLRSKLEGINLGEILLRRVQPTVIDFDQERELLWNALDQAVSLWTRVRSRGVFEFTGTKGRGPSAPERHLIPFLEDSKPPSSDYLDSLRIEKTITGRRFYWAALSSESLRVSLRQKVLNQELDSHSISWLFTVFRIFFGFNRARIQPSGHDLYIAHGPRRRMIRQVLELFPDMAQELHQISTFQPIDRRLVRSWNVRRGETALFRPTLLPGYVSMAVSAFRPSSRLEFLTACLRANELEQVQTLRSIESQVEGLEDRRAANRKEYDELVTQAVRFYGAYVQGKDPKKEAQRALIRTWALTVFSSLPPNLSSVISLLEGIQTTHDYWKEWESSRNKTALLLAKNVMPSLLPNRQTTERVQEIFRNLPSVP